MEIYQEYPRLEILMVFLQKRSEKKIKQHWLLTCKCAKSFIECSKQCSENMHQSQYLNNSERDHLAITIDLRTFSHFSQVM